MQKVKTQKILKEEHLEHISPKSDITKSEISTKPEAGENILEDLEYICGSTSLIINSLQEGGDVAQLPNGDIIITEVVTVNILYRWDKDKQKMVKVSQT